MRAASSLFVFFFFCCWSSVTRVHASPLFNGAVHPTSHREKTHKGARTHTLQQAHTKQQHHAGVRAESRGSTCVVFSLLVCVVRLLVVVETNFFCTHETKCCILGETGRVVDLALVVRCGFCSFTHTRARARTQTHARTHTHTHTRTHTHTHQHTPMHARTRTPHTHSRTHTHSLSHTHHSRTSSNRVLLKV